MRVMCVWHAGRSKGFGQVVQGCCRRHICLCLCGIIFTHVLYLLTCARSFGMNDILPPGGTTSSSWAML
jgi:hypothetical protein